MLDHPGATELDYRKHDDRRDRADQQQPFAATIPKQHQPD